VIQTFFKTYYGYLRAIYRRDPFQSIGIPCWKGYAGPLEDPNEPDGYADNH